MTAKTRTIGLLGGSFNPAHAGHLAISLQALKRLGLKEVWWLVSPGNPLKDPASLADYRLRLETARRVAAHPRIRVSDFEARHGLRYTIDTLRALKRRHPGTRFVWLMGADNLASFDRWRDWRGIAREVGIAVFDRKPFTHAALASKAARRLASVRLSPAYARNPYPGFWVYLFDAPHPESATRLRKTFGDKAFWPHNGNG